MLSGTANRNFSNSAQQIALVIHTKNLKKNKKYRIAYISSNDAPIAIEKNRFRNNIEGQDISEGHCGVFNSSIP